MRTSKNVLWGTVDGVENSERKISGFHYLDVALNGGSGGGHGEYRTRGTLHYTRWIVGCLVERLVALYLHLTVRVQLECAD